MSVPVKIQEIMAEQHEKEMEVTAEYNELFDRLHDCIDHMKRDDSDNIIDVFCEMSLFVEMFFYKKGLHDGIELMCHHNGANSGLIQAVFYF